MRSADGIPWGPAWIAPALRHPIEPSRALAGPHRDLIGASIIRRVDEVAFVAREALLPLDYWAKLALDNARHPPPDPVPYWSTLEHADRQTDAARRRAMRSAEDSIPIEYERAARECDPTKRPSYAGPALGETPMADQTLGETQRIETQMVVQHYAASGRLVDMLV